MEEVVKHLVQHALGGQEWAVRRTEQGWSDTSYVALQGGRRVFVKFGTPADLLHRVAELGVAPAVLAAGEYQGTSYVIQEFIEGKYPDHRWVHDHADDVAGLLRTLHRDATLRYWWAACISLDVTAGLLERGYRDEARGFLDDFLAAASSQPNPRPQNRGLSR